MKKDIDRNPPVYGSAAKVNISWRRIPNDQTSDLMLYTCGGLAASGAVQRTGNFPKFSSRKTFSLNERKSQMKCRLVELNIINPLISEGTPDQVFF